MRWLFIILIFILIFSWASSAKARNDYLGTSYGSCERGRIELYTELRGTDGKDMYQDGDGDPNNSYTSYDDDVNGTVGIRFSWPLQSTCNNDTIDLIEHAITYSDCKNIVLSGGYALNCVNNYRYLDEFPKHNFFVDPNPGDSGTSTGAAIWLHFYLKAGGF